MDIIFTNNIALVDIQLTENAIDCGLLWLDSRAPAYLDIPELGRISIPSELQNRRSSVTIPNLRLEYAPIPSPV